MHMIFRATAVFALVVASFPAGAASATATRAWQYKPESVAGLAVRNLIGDIRVERGTTTGVHITANTTVEAGTQAEAERLAGLIEYRTSDIGAGSRFDVRLPREHFPKIYWENGASSWWSTSFVEYLGERIRLSGDKSDAPVVRVDLLIRAPAGAKLEVSNVFGEIAAQGYAGNLRLDGGSGLLRSASGEGEVVLDNGSGEVVVVGHRGRVDADTGSGSVKITDCECEIFVDTGSGSVDVQGGKGSVSADTGSGSVRARGLSNVTSFEVDTGSGGVTIEGDLSALTRLWIDTGSGSVTLRSPAQPSMEIRIDTGSGGVDIAAPGATVRESDDVWTLRMKDGVGRGGIDTGSGSVDIDFR